jgi:hypothetical protein
MDGRLALALLSLVVIPLAGAQSSAPSVGFQNPSVSTPEELYFHLYGFQEFPINTQPPRDDVGLDAGVGITTHTTSCLPDAPYVGHDYNTLFGFSSPGYVEYNDAEGGKPRYHPERQLSYPVGFDADQAPVLHWYLSTWTGVSQVAGQDPNTAPLVVPQVRVRAIMRTAGTIGGGLDGYETGTPFAHGTSETALLAADHSQGATYSVVDGKPVYEILVPLAYDGDATVPKQGGYTLQVDTYLDNPACDPDTGRLMPNLVRIHSSKDHRPRLSARVMDPLQIEYVHPQVLGDGLAVHVAANSPFGNYDVDEGNVTLSITGPTPATHVALATFTQHTHDHDRHDEAADFAFLWQFRDDGAAPGNYSITVSVRNDQHTAVAVATALVELGSSITVTGCGSKDGPATTCSTESVDSLGNDLGGAKKSPFPAVPGVAVLALALAAGVGRRRH